MNKKQVVSDSKKGVVDNSSNQKCIDSSADKNKRAFHAQLESIRGGLSRPKDIAIHQVTKVGVIGAGVMGRGIAFVAASVGIYVVLVGRTQDSAERGKDYIESLCDKQIRRGRFTDRDKEGVLKHIQVATDVSVLEDCQLVIEAVYETLEVKTELIRRVEEFIGKDVIVGSNTSTLPISSLAEASPRPANFIGIHFFSPVDKMLLVEIICGDQTSEKALAVAFDFARQLGKTPIVVNDSVGFFTSRVYSTYMDEGARLLLEGVEPERIDALAMASGMPLGPLSIMDEIGQILLLKIAETHRSMGVFGRGGDTSVSTQVVEMMVSRFGRGGRRHGGGFYEYSVEDGSKTLWGGLKGLFEADANIPDRDIQDRLLVRQIIESLNCLEEGVLESVADGNIGSRLGIAAPEWTGGYLQVVNTWDYQGLRGLDAFRSRATELAKDYGERFYPPNLLPSLLKGGEPL
jgi:3-hydroxyacyl-CoA dehydrogenase/enoyl-CoA hydratase/3-hydroxybutyryl-CoA epimerase